MVILILLLEHDSMFREHIIVHSIELDLISHILEVVLHIVQVVVLLHILFHISNSLLHHLN